MKSVCAFGFIVLCAVYPLLLKILFLVTCSVLLFFIVGVMAIAFVQPSWTSFEMEEDEK
jgi:hypothetical protein